MVKPGAKRNKYQGMVTRGSSPQFEIMNSGFFQGARGRGRIRSLAITLILIFGSGNKAGYGMVENPISSRVRHTVFE